MFGKFLIIIRKGLSGLHRRTVPSVFLFSLLALAACDMEEANETESPDLDGTWIGEYSLEGINPDTGESFTVTTRYTFSLQAESADVSGELTTVRERNGEVEEQAKYQIEGAYDFPDVTLTSLNDEGAEQTTYLGTVQQDGEEIAVQTENPLGPTFTLHR